ncbi:MAG: ImmA/IrrE family metallo-endopeptidase [Acidimicrobiia bacterium]|nr:ImmA/IrrE family metallo-endopeptidase [Acidimicrobiia bacterium]
MSIRVEVRPPLLEWARARSGIAQEDWDRRFPRYEAWLAGETAPTLKQLEEFARKTHTPVGFLFLDRPPAEPVPIPDFRTVGDRPVGAGEVVSADLLDVVYTCQARQEWYRDHQLLNGEPPLAFVGTATTTTPTERAAADMSLQLGWDAEARARYRTWVDALTRLRENAEAAGVLVMISGIVGSDTHRKLVPDEFRGFALADTYAPLVFVNGADSKAAQVFTLAHELAHLWLGETALSDLDPASVRDNTVERWCNQVAAELLVPMEEFRAQLDAFADVRSQLQPLAEHFRVSTQVILGRFREAGELTWDEYLHELGVERARVAAIVAERGSGGNYYNTKPVQIGKRFARALVASAMEGQTSYTEAFRLLGLKKASTFDGLADRLGVR